ncbi:hypothetical protein OE88DRAFT_1644628 [Heliocybe sulcata]|uniref:Uncharacterized protein n=1 Tax=Heliocybe sulcata TaxID=5364 RepID=A0A5C3N3V8_9AGAM|nr:hypothetical protein OE88DRAFT_1644628 [Heliocybe sulcata]
MPRARKAAVVRPPPLDPETFLEPEGTQLEEPKKRKRRTAAEREADDAALKVECQRKADEKKEAARLKAAQKQADKDKAKAQKDAAKAKMDTGKANAKTGSRSGRSIATRSKHSTELQYTQEVLLADETSAAKKVADLEQKLAQDVANKNQGRITNIAQLQPPRLSGPVGAASGNAPEIPLADAAVDKHGTLDPSSDISMLSDNSLTQMELSIMSGLGGNLSTEATQPKKARLAQTDDTSQEQVALRDGDRIGRTPVSEEDEGTPATKPGKAISACVDFFPVRNKHLDDLPARRSFDGHSSHSPLVQSVRRASLAATPTLLARLNVHGYAPSASTTTRDDGSVPDRHPALWTDSNFLESGDEDVEHYSALHSPLKTPAARTAQSKALAVKEGTHNIEDSDSDSSRDLGNHQDEERGVAAHQRPRRHHIDYADDDEDHLRQHRYPRDERSTANVVGDVIELRPPYHADSRLLTQKEYQRPQKRQDEHVPTPFEQRSSGRDWRDELQDCLHNRRDFPQGRHERWDMHSVGQDLCNIAQDSLDGSRGTGDVAQDRRGMAQSRSNMHQAPCEDAQARRDNHEESRGITQNRRGVIKTHRHVSQERHDNPQGVSRDHRINMHDHRNDLHDHRIAPQDRCDTHESQPEVGGNTRVVSASIEREPVPLPADLVRRTTDMMVPGVNEHSDEEKIPSRVTSKRRQAQKKREIKSSTPEVVDMNGRSRSPTTVDFFDEEELDCETRSEATDESGSRKKKHVTISDLPGGIGHDVRWNKMFIPTVYNYVATHRDPWTISDEDFVPVLQEVYNSVFRDDYGTYQVKAKDAIYTMTHKRLHDWRNGLGNAAIQVLEAYWNSQQGKFTTYSERQAYAADAVKNYKFSFAQTNSSGSPQDWDGLLQGALIVRTLAFHYSIVKQATICPISATVHQGRDKAPVGAIGLAACVVERILRKWQRKEVTVLNTGEVKVLPSNVRDGGLSDKATRGKTNEDVSGSSFSAGDYGKKTRGWSKCAEQLDGTEIGDLIQSAVQIAGGVARHYKGLEAYDSDEDERALLAVRRRK